MDAAQIAEEILAHSAALKFEVETLTACFAENNFFGDPNNFRHGHYGYLMTCLAQIDVLSVYEKGVIKRKEQTPRMQSFLDRHLRSGRSEEHRVAIELFRHKLMHTGALRYVYDTTTNTAYTWRVYFTDAVSIKARHFTLSLEDMAHQQDLLSYAPALPSTIKALNIHIPSLAADINNVSESYVTAMLADPALQQKVQDVYPLIRLQTFDS